MAQKIALYIDGYEIDVIPTPVDGRVLRRSEDGYGFEWSTFSDYPTISMGSKTNFDNVYETIGCIVQNIQSIYTYEFKAVIETSNTAQLAEVRLFDISAGLEVPGSYLSTLSDVPELNSSTITPISGERIFEIQLRSGSSDPLISATCKTAFIVRS